MRIFSTFGITVILINLLTVMIPHAAHSQAIPLTYSNIQSILSEVHTPKDLAKFMRKNFKFKEDSRLFGSIDYWQSPEEFWISRTGDCEDYALFTKYVLDQIGIESHVVSFYGDRGYAHTVTVYKENGRYSVINEDRHYDYRAASIEDALSRIYPYWQWGGIAEKRGSRGWMMERLDNNDYREVEDFRSNFAEFPF